MPQNDYTVMNTFSNCKNSVLNLTKIGEFLKVYMGHSKINEIR